MNFQGEKWKKVSVITFLQNQFFSFLKVALSGHFFYELSQNMLAGKNGIFATTMKKTLNARKNLR